VDGKVLLDILKQLLTRFVVLPKWAAEALALWIIHTYAFLLRDVTTYIGIESPEHRCGKSTLVTVLSELTHRSVVSSNISPPAFFRVIEDFQPTLFIDEADTLLPGNEQLRGILNSGYTRKTGFVLRVGNQVASSGSAAVDSNAPVNRFSSWCPKVIARIGRLPVTLADRCIVLRMQRKTANEECDRVKNLDALPLKRQCARFVQDHAAAIAAARPELPSSLNDRAADIWEPLFALADLAGGDWPDLSRKAAVALAETAQDQNPIASLMMDIFFLFFLDQRTTNVERIFTRTLVDGLNCFTDRPWLELSKGKEITDSWLSKQLRPYGIRPKNIRIGEEQAKGYLQADCIDTFRRYIPKSERDAYLAHLTAAASDPPVETENNGSVP
jgi:hypothetical protein